MREIKTPREALTVALFLAITAETEEQSEMALALAEEVAAGLPPADITAAKRNAMRRVKNCKVGMAA